MIKLPLVTTAADTDAGLTSTTFGKSSKETKGLSDDFLSLFGKALPGQLTLEDGKTLSLSAALKKVTGKDAAADDAGADKTTLADLLDKLDADRPEALTALLANSGKELAQDKTTETDTAADGSHKLSPADMQALSALFAMLPQQDPAAPATALVAASAGKNSDETSALSALLGGSSAQAKTTPGKAEDSLTAPDGTEDNKFAVKTPAPAAQQAVDDAALPAATVDKESRDSAISNNTAPTVTATPALSSATVSTPVSTQIATPVAPQISAQLGSQEWQQAVSQQVTLFTRQGQQSAELRLHPEDLGQIQITLKLDDNQAQLQMTSPHGHVRAALEATLPTLRTALAESGIQLGQSSISSGGENFAQQQQQSGQQQASQRSAGSFPGPVGEAESAAVPASIQRLASGNNAVDIFA
ncbi:flagellar hook-length control protein FliK [Dryocola clanedunensis]